MTNHALPSSASGAATVVGSGVQGTAVGAGVPGGTRVPGGFAVPSLLGVLGAVVVGGAAKVEVGVGGALGGPERLEHATASRAIAAMVTSAPGRRVAIIPSTQRMRRASDCPMTTRG